MSRENTVMKACSAIIAPLVALVLVILAPIPSHAANELRFVVLGDSLVAGYGLQPGEAFPEQLEKALAAKGVSVEIENAGVSGDTTTGGLARLDWSVPDGIDGVIVELGANDALRGIPPDVTRANLEAIVSRLKSRGIGVLLAGMQAPPNMGEDYATSFNPIYGDIAAAQDVMLYPFFLDGVAAEAALNQADGMHPTAEGIEVIVERFLPVMQQFIGGLETAASATE